jgi:hypothetical protein
LQTLEALRLGVRGIFPSITMLRGKQGVLAPDVELVRVL